MKANFTKEFLAGAVSLSVVFCISACNYDATKDDQDATANQLQSGISFAQVESQVFAVSCNSCHSQQGGPDLSNFSTANSKLAQIQSDVFVSHSMPKTGSLSSQQESVLNSWIAEGGPLNASNNPVNNSGPVAAPVPLVQIADLTFDNLNQKIFHPQCSKCHGSGEGIDVTSYAGVKASLGQISVAALANQVMPPKTPLSASDRALLSAWINAGAPETALTATQILPTYESINANIFQPLCMNCHGEGNIAKEVPLQPYSAMIAAQIGKNKAPLVSPGHSADSVLYQLILPKSDGSAPMPPSSNTGLAALPTSMTTIIQQWIDAGAPQQ